MKSAGHEVLITGIGLVSTLGEGLDAHWHALNAANGPQPPLDREQFAPHSIHPLAAIEFDKQIPKRGDQRQMEPWQRIGTYAAGMALEDAGIKGDEELLARTDMIVSAGGGERDIAVDSAVLNEILDQEDYGRTLNERLASDLRPTLFLAQLPNLLAGNISIVHKVTGSSRTFMGEEMAGVDAVRTARARIASGQSDICLVGGSFNAARHDLILLFELGGYLWREEWVPVWERGASGGGIVPGSMGAFLVLESAAHALQRGKAGLARLDGVLSERSARKPGQAGEVAARQLDQLRPALSGALFALLSGATGAESATSEERTFLDAVTKEHRCVVRAGGTAIGHGFEAQFPALVALAALLTHRGTIYPPRDSSGMEAPHSGAIEQALVTLWGHWRGEGMALVSALG